MAENHEIENATQENNKLLGDSIISKTPKIASTIPVHGGLYDKNCYWLAQVDVISDVFQQ